MEKRSLGLAVALVTIFISLPLLLAKPSNKNKGDCPKPKGKDCTKEEDREIMRCCLEKYKKGFDDLKGQAPLPGQDPPTCQTDLVSSPFSAPDRILSHHTVLCHTYHALRPIIRSKHKYQLHVLYASKYAQNHIVIILYNSKNLSQLLMLTHWEAYAFW